MKLLATLGAIGALAIGALLLSAAPAQAATITVTTPNDLFAAGPVGCSLRRAINAANNNSDFNGCVGVGPYGNDVIVFDPAIVTVTLTINAGGGDNDSNSYRDLDIGDLLTGGSLNIIGPPAGIAVVAGAGLGDRVFDITPNAVGNVTMTNLIIVGGLTPATTYETGVSSELCYRGGGGIRHRGGGQLTLTNVRVLDNTARGGGGVCYAGNGNSRLSVIGSVIQGNATQGSDGGGILSAGPTLISGTRVLSNTAVISEATALGGGGIFHGPASSGVALEVIGGVVSFNRVQHLLPSAAAHGGGINARAIATLTQVSVFSNTLSALAAGTNAVGGGVFSNHSVLVDRAYVAGNVITTSATGSGMGGGLYTAGIFAEIIGGQILSNVATNGGGWYNITPDAMLFGSEVRFNQAYVSGGGIHNALASGVSIASAIICDNKTILSMGTGGGLLHYGTTSPTLYVQDTVLCNNQARAAGGGLSNRTTGIVVLSRVHITGNVSEQSCGGIHHDGARLILSDSTVSANQAANVAGAVCATSTTFEAMNATFSGNQSLLLGAIRLLDSTAYFTYTSIVSNTAGSGLSLGGSSSVTTRATLLAYNSGENCNASAPATLISANDNLSSDATCAALTASNDLTNTNPLLRPLGFASPFDFTPTHLPMPNSPALNRIPPARCIPADQRNVLRPQNGACDVGAVEMATWHNYAPIVRKP